MQLFWIEASRGCEQIIAKRHVVINEKLMLTYDF